MTAALTLDDVVRMIPAEYREPIRARLGREDLKNKAYQLCPLGEDAAGFLRVKRKSLSENSLAAYESTLDKFCRHFADLELKDFEPPVGTERVETFLDEEWGDAKGTTYNRHLSALKEFFKHAVRRGKLHGDPMLNIDKARTAQHHRTTYSEDQCRVILASQSSLRDRIALTLLLDYGLRRGSLRAVQFKHFDHIKHRLTIFAKGSRIQVLPIPDPAFWHSLERHILDAHAEGDHFLMAARWANQRSGRVNPLKPMSAHGIHGWFYRCLTNAGIVEEGTTSGEPIHKCRHTAGQRLLDATGNIKAVQVLLGHKSISTTGDIYTDIDVDGLGAIMAGAMERRDG